MNALLENAFRRAVISAAALFLATAPAGFAAENSSESSSERQRKLIAILQSDAPPQEKAIPCKQLAIYGNKEAVPALAPLLANKDLASWARIALEAIPGPEADAALREALPKLEGNLLIGVINSIGARRDARAIEALAGKLNDADAEAVAAAAVALGKIGGAQAGKALQQALARGNKESLPAVSEGVILCAERFLEDGKFDDAVALYDAVRKAEVPRQRKLEATRGAILARQTAGLPLLLEQLRSAEKAEFGMALRTARELQGREVTEAIGAELDRAGSDRQVMLLLALADRKDDAVFPKLLQVAEKGSRASRIATLGLLDRFHDFAAVPVLLTAAAEEDAEIAQPAKATLTRMEGKPVDDALLERLPKSLGRTRQVIIELAALRRLEQAVPMVVLSAHDSDPNVRKAALTTLSILGTEAQADELVTLLSRTSDAGDREQIERALTSICGRAGTKCLPQVLPLVKHDNSELRLAGLRTLATIGGPEALTAVTSAVADPDESVQDEAVGTLATWPNNWPDDAAVAEPLLNLVKSGRKTSYQVQGTRGYLLYVRQSNKLNNDEKLSAIERLLPLLKRTQEKQLAIAALTSIPAGRTLEQLANLANDPALTEEACLGMVNVATAKNVAASKEARKAALQTALDKSKNDATRKKATEALQSMQ